MCICQVVLAFDFSSRLADWIFVHAFVVYLALYPKMHFTVFVQNGRVFISIQTSVEEMYLFLHGKTRNETKQRQTEGQNSGTALG